MKIPHDSVVTPIFIISHSNNDAKINIFRRDGEGGEFDIKLFDEFLDKFYTEHF